MPVGLLTLDIRLPGCSSLKEKRSRLKPLISRLHRDFNISVAEMDHQDSWKEAVIVCAVVSNDAAHTQRVLQKVLHWIENKWPDGTVFDDWLEII